MEYEPPLDAPARDAGEYQVVARKYRPQAFDQLVGQATISQGLASAITTNRVGHAYLFTGARGTGKTSTARIFAKALNCVDGPTPTPCNQCDICQGITSGGDVDVLEIDGASNRGIDEIRQLRANVSIRPSRARYKIYIIDEVHMLTKEAFNALLKTLEEPPEHVKFIFCTTDPEKIPITVLSRCQRFDFAPVATLQIRQRLEQIVAAEKVTAEPAALELLARRAAGSMRDSQSLLEQLLSVSNGRIAVEDVHRMLGTARSGRLATIIADLEARQAASALAGIDAAVTEGVDVAQLAEQLLGHLRDLLTATVGGSPDILLHSSPDEHAALVETGKRLGVETLLAMLQILDQSLVRMRQSVHPRVLLEVAIVRLCQLESLDDLSSLMSQLQIGTVSAVASAAAPGVASRGPTPTATLAPEKKTDHVTAPPHETETTQTPSRILDTGNAADVWQQVLEAVGDMTAEMGRCAKSVAISGPNRLVVSFPAEYSSQKDFCDRPTSRNRFEQVLRGIVGQTARLEFALLPGEPKLVERTAPPPNKRQMMKERERHPLVQATMEAFGAEMIEVEEPRRTS